MSKILQTLGLVAQGYYWYELGLVDHNSFADLFEAIKVMPFKEQALYGIQAYLFIAFTIKLLTGLLFFKYYLFFPVNAIMVWLQWGPIQQLIAAIKAGTFTKNDVENAVELIGPFVSLIGVILATYTPLT